jgi:colanic acid/amylovoran biosynthesis protein
MGASFDTGNQGVSALAASLVGLVKRARPDASICFFIGSRDGGPREVKISDQKIEYTIIHYRLSPKSRPREHLLWIFMLACFQRVLPLPKLRKRIASSNPCLKALLETEFIGDIRGGDSFGDVYGLSRMISGAIPDLIVLLLGKPLILLPQTYGPYRSALARSIASIIMKRASYILSRDREGVAVVAGLLSNHGDQKILFCPDVAFTMSSVSPAVPDIRPALVQAAPRPPLIGFNINGLLFNGGYTRSNMFGLRYDYKKFAHRLARQILRETSCDLLLVPHTFAPAGHVESDSAACQEVFDLLRNEFQTRVHLVSREDDQSEMKGIIGLCDFFIGSRMHACIAALSQGIPTVGIAYSQKFKGVFDSIGLGEMVLDARALEEETTVTYTLEFIRNQSDHRIAVREKIAHARQMVEETFFYLLNKNGSSGRLHSPPLDKGNYGVGQND